MELSTLKEQFNFAKQKDKEIRGTFDFNNWAEKLKKLKQESANPNFWENNHEASVVLKKISSIEKKNCNVARS